MGGGGGFLNFVAPGLGSLVTGGGDLFQNIIDPIGTPLGEALGIHTPADYAFSAPWDYPQMWKDDWRAIKHMIMPDMRKDRESMVNAADTPRRIIYGRVRVSGQMCYACTSGDKFQYLHIIVAFAGHPIDGFEDIYLDDKLISDAQFAGNISYELYDGRQTSACASMMSASGGLWTSAHVGYGIPYIYCRFTYSDGAFPSGVPTVKAVLRGKRVYDPRSGVTAWSENPACCALDYMVMPENIGGMGCDTSAAFDAAVATGSPYTTSSIGDEVKFETVIEAANYSDESVVLSGIPTETRYTCNGTMDVSNTPAALLSPVMACMDTNPVYMQGQWNLCISKTRAANSSVIDESWLNGGIAFKTGANKNELINTAKGTFINPLDHWAMTDFPIVQIPSYLAADLEELTLDMSFPFTDSPYTTQRLARMAIERSRISQTVTYPCNLKALAVAANDVVKVNNTLLGWSERLFRVLDWQFAPTGGINLTLGFENPAIYGVNPGDLTPLAVPDLTTLPSPWDVSAPVLNKPTEEIYISGTASIIKTRVFLTWQQYSSGITNWVIEASDNGGITWRACGSSIESQFALNDESAGSKIYRVKAINSIGAVSAWGTINYIVLGKTYPPANVANLRASATSFGGLILTWDAVSDIDLDHYAIRWCATTTHGWENSIDIGSAYTTTITIPAALDGIYLIKAVDTSSIESLSATSIITTIPSITNYNAIAIVDDGPGWGGTKVDCYAVGGKLYLDMAGLFDEITDFDALMNIDTYGGSLPTGYYTVSSTVDLSDIQTSRCSVSVDYTAIDTSLYFDSLLDFDAITFFDGDAVPGVMVQPQIRLSQNGTDWSDWQAFVAGDYTAMQLQFRLKLTTNIAYNIPEVTSFSVSVDMPDRSERGQGVSVSASGTAVTFVKPYKVPPIIRTSILSATSGDTEKITAITTTGFTIQILNAGSGVARTVDWQSVGY